MAPRPGCVETIGRTYRLTDLGYMHILELATLGFEAVEIADYLRVSRQWLRDALSEDAENFDERALDVFNEGRHEFRKRIRIAQGNLAESNAQMAIWLGKTVLGQKENPQEIKHTIQVVGTMPDRAQTPDEWQRQFAPAGIQQIAQQKQIEVLDLEAEDETGQEDGVRNSDGGATRDVIRVPNPRHRDIPE